MTFGELRPKHIGLGALGAVAVLSIPGLALLIPVAATAGAVVAVRNGSSSLGMRANTLGTWSLASVAVAFGLTRLPPLHDLTAPFVFVVIGLTLATDTVGVLALVRGDGRSEAARGLAKAALPTLGIAVVVAMVVAFLLDPHPFVF